MGEIIADREARYLERIATEDATLEEIVSKMCGSGPVDKPYQGLPDICKEWDIPYSKVLLWLMAIPERYSIYARALEIQAKGLVSETVDIADAGVDVQRDKLRVDTRFRLAKYHDSKTYGDKVDVNHNVTPLFSIVVNGEIPGIAALEAGGDPAQEIEDAVIVERSVL